MASFLAALNDGLDAFDGHANADAAAIQRSTAAACQ